MPTLLSASATVSGNTGCLPASCSLSTLDVLILPLPLPLQWPPGSLNTYTTAYSPICLATCTVKKCIVQFEKSLAIQKFRGIPQNLAKFRGIPQNLEKFQGIPQNLEKFRGIPQSLEKFGGIPQNLEKF